MEAMKLEPIKRTTMTVLEASEYMGLSIEFMYILCREKRIPHFRLGSRILLKREKLDQFIEEQIEENMKDGY